MDIGLTAQALTDVSDVSDRRLMEFRVECKDFLMAALKKLLQKCPLSYSLVRNMSSLDPRQMAKPGNKTLCRAKFKKVVSVMCSAKKVKGDNADEVVQQYSSFLDNIPNYGSEKFVKFSLKNDRIDELLSSCLKEDDTYSKLWDLLQTLLVLSHGQASVERGFSVNKEVEVENLRDQTLVAQRLVCDQVVQAGGVTKVPITNALLVSAAMARQRYESYLEEEKQKKTADEQRKRKNILEEVAVIKKRKIQITKDIASLTKSADDLAEKAEASGNLTLVTKSNAFRRKAKTKQKELTVTEKQLNDKVHEIQDS